jgi:hypothetical protein
MPRFDATGPFGQGPMGRGLGPCSAGRRGVFGPDSGRGFRGDRCFSGAWNRPRLGWNPGRGLNPAPQDETQALKQEASYLQSELDAIQKRLAEVKFCAAACAVGNAL